MLIQIDQEILQSYICSLCFVFQSQKCKVKNYSILEVSVLPRPANPERSATSNNPHLNETSSIWGFP